MIWLSGGRRSWIFRYYGHRQKLREALSLCPLKLIAFSNSPRKYALRVLKELNLDKFFLLKMLCHIYDHNQIFVWRHADDRYACFHSSVIIECM
mmetsp:Transcript_15351/g.21884  ORF Transcript_15351/g.21884 Transcript_15351/m.21884 type:complete len:94 (-) Transcript_15351:61-342(-)